jgi:hypothetical protein
LKGALQHAGSSLPRDVLVGYYLLTPVFALADVLAGISVRVAGLGAGGPRAVYYAVAFALGLFCRWKPTATPWVGMLESSGNLLLLLLSILLPIWTLPEVVLAGGEATAGLDTSGMVNALLAGAALVVSFHRHRLAVTPRGTT